MHWTLGATYRDRAAPLQWPSPGMRPRRCSNCYRSDAQTRARIHRSGRLFLDGIAPRTSSPRHRILVAAFCVSMCGLWDGGHGIDRWLLLLCLLLLLIRLLQLYYWCGIPSSRLRFPKTFWTPFSSPPTAFDCCCWFCFLLAATTTTAARTDTYKYTEAYTRT